MEENSDNPREVWKTINKVLDTHSNLIHTPLSVIYEGQHIKKPFEIVDLINIHFISIGPKLADDIETRANNDPLKYVCNEELPDKTSFKFQRVDPELTE